ncbi:MAG: hypothetical protein Q4A66_03140 [Eubacteriales bacterium]|nr:hypothetical protein [Eubacteriales bacterium]
MKKILCWLVAALLCMGAALAEVEEFGGTKEWPQFRGMQMGLSLQAAAMHEQSAGVDLRLWGMEETKLSDAKESYLTAVNMIGRDVPMYGEEVTVLYEMASNTLHKAHGYAAFAREEDAQAYYDRIYADLVSLYGEPDEGSEWNIGYGYRLLVPESQQGPEGFSGTLSVKLQDLYEALQENGMHRNIAYLREQGLEIPEGGWLVSFGLSQGYLACSDWEERAFYADPRAYH